jgi:hypothetical protein
MSDETSTAVAANGAAAPERAVAAKRAVAAVDRFAADHGGASAVAQPVSFDQVRITLVGADGTLGDVLVGDVAAAASVIEASSATGAEWDRELSASVTLNRANRLRMAGGRAR